MLCPSETGSRGWSSSKSVIVPCVQLWAECGLWIVMSELFLGLMITRN